MSNKTGKKRKREDDDYVPTFDEESEEEYNPDTFNDSPKEPPQKKLKLTTIFAPIDKTVFKGSYSTTTSTITTPNGTFTPVDDMDSVELSNFTSSIPFVKKPPPKLRKRSTKFPFKNPVRNAVAGRTRSFRQLISVESKRIGNSKDPNYTGIEASVSTCVKKKKYCDISGLEGKFVDPKTKLRYHSQKVYGLISEFKNKRLKFQYIDLRNGTTLGKKKKKKK